MNLKKPGVSLLFAVQLIVSLICITNTGLCSPLPVSEVKTSEQEDGSMEHTEYEYYESESLNTQPVTSVSTRVNSSDKIDNNQLFQDLNESVMSQMCTQTISNIPKDSSLFLSVQMMCKLNHELTSLNKSKHATNTLELNEATLRTEPLSSTTKESAGNILNSESDDNELLLEGYNKQFPPRLNENFTLPDGTIIHVEKPVTVKSYIFVRSIRNVDEINEKVTVDMDLYLFWMDGRIRNELSSKGKKLKLQFVEHEPILKTMKKSIEQKIWIPDVFFEEAEHVNRPQILDDRGQVLLLYEDYGAPFLRLRMRVTLDCGMNFYRYPADIQKCQFHLRSSSYKNDEVRFTWWRRIAHGVYLSETSDPNFDFQVTGVEEYDDHIDIGPESPKVRESSHLKFELWIRRKMSYHLIQTYLPSVFFIIVTWLAYLIPPRLVEARIGVTMTTLLTMTSMFSSIRESTPIVGYVKAVDIWMVICVFFIFLTLTALTVGACIRSVKRHLKKRKESLPKSDDKRDRIHLKMKILNIFEVFLERYMVFLLCALFVLFVCLYWSWLMNDSSDYLSWAPNSTYNRIVNH